VEIVKSLLGRKEFDFSDKECSRNRSVLENACELGHYAVVELLMNQPSVNVNAGMVSSCLHQFLVVKRIPHCTKLRYTTNWRL